MPESPDKYRYRKCMDHMAAMVVQLRGDADWLEMIPSVDSIPRRLISRMREIATELREVRDEVQQIGEDAKRIMAKADKGQSLDDSSPAPPDGRVYNKDTFWGAVSKVTGKEE